MSNPKPFQNSQSWIMTLFALTLTRYTYMCTVYIYIYIHINIEYIISHTHIFSLYICVSRCQLNEQRLPANSNRSVLPSCHSPGIFPVNRFLNSTADKESIPAVSSRVGDFDFMLAGAWPPSPTSWSFASQYGKLMKITIHLYLLVHLLIENYQLPDIFPVFLRVLNPSMAFPGPRYLHQPLPCEAVQGLGACWKNIESKVHFEVSW